MLPNNPPPPHPPACTHGNTTVHIMVVYWSDKLQTFQIRSLGALCFSSLQLDVWYQNTRRLLDFCKLVLAHLVTVPVPKHQDHRKHKETGDMYILSWCLIVMTDEWAVQLVQFPDMLACLNISKFLSSILCIFCECSLARSSRAFSHLSFNSVLNSWCWFSSSFFLPLYTS